MRPSCHGDSRERKVRPGQGGTPPRRVQRRPRRSSQASRSRVRSAALADPIRNGTYGTRKVATANGKITTTPEGAGYHGVFAGALEGSRRWRGWQQEGAGRGAGDGGRRGDAKPQRARVPGRGNSGAPTLREARDSLRYFLSELNTIDLCPHRDVRSYQTRVRGLFDRRLQPAL